MEDNKVKDRNLDYLTKMDKTKFEILDLHDDTSKQDREYWMNKSVSERLMALEILRQRIYNYDPNTARVQRVLEYTELK
ncbi:MAG: hypothetical protein J0M18_18805 [Ignavibacteria bacterium]|jgi:hypothetical protein|nr:hypothetical protein [Ignavibacteria bacterium]